jgi:DnaJ like chaperone protein
MSSLARKIDTFAASHEAVAIDLSNAAQTYRLESVAFYHAVTAVCAKLATADGAANKKEYDAFQALFVEQSAMDVPHARSLFVQRAADAGTAVQYARQIVAMTRGQTVMHMDLLQRLLRIAVADGALNAAELECLRAVAETLEVPKAIFRSLVAQSFASASATPYDVLGVSPRASDKELRDAYVARANMLHPDRHIAAGASAETISMLSDQLAVMNAAYQSVQYARSRVASVTPLADYRNTKGADTMPV